MQKHFYFFFLFVTINSLSAQTPTWADNIACIVYSHCSTCHNPGSIAPFSLTTYEDAYAWRYSIYSEVEEKHMPPFHANTAYQQYSNDISLTQNERDQILAWVNGDAPRGNPDIEPPSPVFGNEFGIEDPDLVLQIPDFTVTTGENDMFRCFVLPTGIDHTAYITSMQVIPGNSNIVHHAIISQDDSPVPAQLDAADPLPGYLGAGTGSPFSISLGVYTPGQNNIFFPDGFGKKLNANASIILQIHYPAGINGVVDSTRILLKFGPNNVRRISDGAFFNNSSTLTNPPLEIPAGTMKTFFSEKFLEDSLTLFSVMPHMHLIGSTFKVFCVTPSNDTINLIDIPEWDFHWQGYYYFKKPIIIPAGSVLYGASIYDNTVNNPYNPFNPPEDIHQGESTTEEMLKFHVNYVHYEPGDETLFLDTTTHLTHYNGCTTSWTGTIDTIHVFSLERLYPNPAGDYYTLEFQDPVAGELTMHNSAGQPVFTTACEGQEITVPVHGLPAGMYILSFTNQDGQIIRRKLIKE